MYRDISLINGNGQTFELTKPETKVLASGLQGFGFSTSSTMLRIGDESETTYEQHDLVPINFDANFYGTEEEIYNNYRKFVKFLSYKPIYVLYKTPNSEEVYRRKVNTTSVTKSEIQPNGILVCPVVFNSSSFWEDNIERVVTASKSTEGTGKSYPLSRPYFYATLSTDNVGLNYTGGLKTPLRIEINGVVVNPQYNIFDEAGQLYGVGKLIGSYDKVVVDSDEFNELIELTKNDVLVDNPYNAQDFSVMNPEAQFTFIKMKEGENTMVFNLDTSFTGSISVKWRNRYLSV